MTRTSLSDEQAGKFADRGRRWQLKHKDFPRRNTGLFALLSTARTAYKHPARCLHTSRRWRGGFNWDCLDCGEAVLDREEKTQTTFSSTIYTTEGREG